MWVKWRAICTAHLRDSHASTRYLETTPQWIQTKRLTAESPWFLASPRCWNRRKNNTLRTKLRGAQGTPSIEKWMRIVCWMWNRHKTWSWKRSLWTLCSWRRWCSKWKWGRWSRQDTTLGCSWGSSSNSRSRSRTQQPACYVWQRLVSTNTQDEPECNPDHIFFSFPELMPNKYLW